MQNDIKRNKKLIVIADDQHRSAFNPIFHKSEFELDYISDVSQSQAECLNPKNVGRYLVDNFGVYDGLLICGCCGDSLPMVSDKKIFPGKVIFFDYRDIHPIATYDGKNFGFENYQDIISGQVDVYIDGPKLGSVILEKIRQAF